MANLNGLINGINCQNCVNTQKDYIMRAPKLNKAQTLELMIKTISTTINSHTDLFKKDKSDIMVSLLSDELAHVFAPKKGGGTSTKIDSNGDVYCNYFDKYLPASEFNTKLSKPNKITGERTEGYKANCKDAEIILRKIKSLKIKYSNQVMDNFRAKIITAEEMEKYLDNLDTVFSDDSRYYRLEDIPTITEIFNLGEDGEDKIDNLTDAKPVRG